MLSQGALKLDEKGQFTIVDVQEQEHYQKVVASKKKGQ